MSEDLKCLSYLKKGKKVEASETDDPAKSANDVEQNINGGHDNVTFNTEENVLHKTEQFGTKF